MKPCSNRFSDNVLAILANFFPNSEANNLSFEIPKIRLHNSGSASLQGGNVQLVWRLSRQSYSHIHSYFIYLCEGLSKDVHKFSNSLFLKKNVRFT